MSEHELWNELGNLYFISGTYSQAAYAYNRSIQLDSGFGRPYCNLALTYVKQGRYIDAVRLYQRSIELLVDDREKAITWYRLGDVYRHLKDYRDAILAYQQADLLDPELSQDRKESGQILCGGSEGTAKPASLPETVPAQAQVLAEPVAVKQEVEALAPVAEPSDAEVVVVLPEEPQIAEPEPEPVREEPLVFAQDEAIQEEQLVEERAAISEVTKAQVALPIEELPQDELDASLLDQPVEAVTALLEPLVEQAALLPQEDELVITEPAAILTAKAPMTTLEEPAEEAMAISAEEASTVDAFMPAEPVEEVPAVFGKIGSASMSESEPAPLVEDTSPEFMTMVESLIQEDLTAVAEAVSDMGGAGWNEEDHQYPDFEHETEVFIPDTQEEAIDQWLPITETESVCMQDLEASTEEAQHYAEAIRSEYQPAPLVPQRYATEVSPAVSMEVDVIVQDEYDQPVFIIPEGTEQEAPQVLAESEQAYPVAAAAQEEEDEELKEIEREIERFQQVVQHNSRNASAWDTLGTLYKSARRYRDAILAYQQAVVVDPLKAPYHHHLGIIYAVEGRDEDAIKAFQEVLEIDPNHNLAHASLGGYYRRMGLEELAQKHIGKAMKNFYNSENEYNRACMEALNGHTEQSIELLRVALKNKQTYVDWVLRDPDLDSIRRDPRFKQLISDFTA